jgi:hypothetical protein
MKIGIIYLVKDRPHYTAISWQSIELTLYAQFRFEVCRIDDGSSHRWRMPYEIVNHKSMGLTHCMKQGIDYCLEHGVDLVCKLDNDVIVTDDIWNIPDDMERLNMDVVGIGCSYPANYAPKAPYHPAGQIGGLFIARSELFRAYPFDETPYWGWSNYQRTLQKEGIKIWKAPLTLEHIGRVSGSGKPHPLYLEDCHPDYIRYDAEMVKTKNNGQIPANHPVLKNLERIGVK